METGKLASEAMERLREEETLRDIFEKLAAAEEQMQRGEGRDAMESLARLRAKYRI